VDLDREPGLDGREKLLEIIDAQVGVNTALHQYLRAALRNSLFDLPEDLIPAQHIGFRAVLCPIEGAKFAFIDADVGVIDITVYDKGDEPFGVQAFAHAVRKLAEGQEIGVDEQCETFRSVQPFVFEDLCDDPPDRGFP
jgi:hypothetical protein